MNGLLGKAVAFLLAVGLIGACSERPAQGDSRAASRKEQRTLESSISGAWVGVRTGPVDSAGVRFVLEESGGLVTGVMYFQDPDNSQYVERGAVSGTRSGNAVQWTAGRASVVGTVAGDEISGTFTYAASDGDPAVSAQLELDRSSCTPETDIAFCSRSGFDCGTSVGVDNCGVRRVVESCGTCAGGTACTGQNKCE